MESVWSRCSNNESFYFLLLRLAVQDAVFYNLVDALNAHDFVLLLYRTFFVACCLHQSISAITKGDRAYGKIIRDYRQ